MTITVLGITKKSKDEVIRDGETALKKLWEQGYDFIVNKENKVTKRNGYFYLSLKCRVKSK